MFKLIKKHKELLLYVVFGSLTTLVDWCVYSVCVKAFSCDITLSNAVSWVASVIFAFVTNKLFVFESRSFEFIIVFKEAVGFFLSRFFTGLIQIFAPLALISVGINQALFGIDGFVAKVLSTTIVIILNYVLSKLIAFRKK